MELNVVSKHRAAIYGFAILWVVAFHAAAINNFDYSFGRDSLWLFKRIMNSGNVGVDMFLFLSGVSLYFSFSKDGDIARFLKKRFLRIAPAVWVLFGWYWVVLYLVESFAPAQLVPRLMLVDFWLMTGDGSIWYVSLILVLYLAYPLVYSFLYSKRAKHPGLRCLALLGLIYLAIVMFHLRNNEFYKTIEVALTRMPVFIMGCYAGKLVHDKKRVSKAFIPVVFVAVAAFFAVLQLDVLHGPARRFFFAFGGISISYAIALVCEGFERLFKGSKKRPLYRFLSWTGAFTLELYVGHIMLNQAMMHFLPWYGMEDLRVYALMAVCAFFLAWAVSKLIALLLKKVSRAR